MPLPSGKPHVEDGDVRQQRADLLQPLLGRGGLPDDVHVVLGVQERFQSRPDQLMVVQDEDADFHSHNIATMQAPRAGRRAIATPRRTAIHPTATLGAVPPLDQIDDPVKLRRLVEAMLMMEGELSLPVVLRHLVG